ncbi:MAG: 1,6-anhydro-N-acetylmuramyl-L-alanine amidase AmpD [Rhodocyclaceae bacterium]|nr:1,6-anhydro-N-acetylmuramyl-L-alanine amidase AmpD [Rhodocyclaceae bacterium]
MAAPAPALDAAGLLAGADFVASPNCDERPPGAEVSLAVVHAISLPPRQFGGNAVERFFTNRLDADEHPYFETIRGLRVSAHFYVRRDGGVIQFVPCAKRAWHAGVSSWRGRERCNDFSIGIELEGCDELPFEAAQYQSLAQLLGALARGYPLRDVAGHADIAPGRKTDPGPCFDWPRLQALLAGTCDLRVAGVQR